MSDEDMMDLFFKAFEEGIFTRVQLQGLANSLGFELTEEFMNEPTPDPIESKK